MIVKIGGEESLYYTGLTRGYWISYGKEEEEEEGVTVEDGSGEFLHKGHVAFIFSHSSMQCA